MMRKYTLLVLFLILSSLTTFANNPPQLSAINNVKACVGDTISNINFNFTDEDTNGVVISYYSLNQAFLPDSLILITGSGASRSLHIYSSAMAGNANIVIKATDTASAVDSVIINVQFVSINLQINSISSIACHGDSSASIAAAYSGGVGTYQLNWSNSQSSDTLTNLSAGKYILNISDSLSCTATDSITLSQPLPLAIKSINVYNINCFGDSTGAIAVEAEGGTMPYTFSWSTTQSGDSIYNLIAGTYSLTVTDTNNCVDTISINVQQPLAALAAGIFADNISCFGLTDGQALASANGGTAPYSFSWSNNSSNVLINALAQGNYSVTITDSLNCTDTATVSISEPALLQSQIALTNDVKCFGGNSGLAAVSISGGTTPYAYNWSSSAITDTAKNLAVGTYYVTITDFNGCLSYDTAIINQPTLLIVKADSATVHVSCFGGSNGSARAFPSGGTLPYQYAWSNNATVNQIGGLSANTYTVTVTDSNACTAQASVTITEPTALTSTISSSTNVTCMGGNNGSATVSASGGTTPYSYLWTSTANTATANNLGVGNFSVTVTDAKLCTSISSVTLSFIHNLPSVSLGADTTICAGQSIVISPGNNFAGYAWSTGSSNSQIMVSTAGIYRVTITDANGCNNSTQKQISLSTAPPCVLIGIDEIENAESFTIYPNPSNGNFNISFSGYKAENIKVEVINTVGQIIISKNISAIDSQSTVSFNENLANGQYFVRIVQNNSIDVKRILIQRN